MSSYFLSEISQIMEVMTFPNNENLVAMLTKAGPPAQIVENCKDVNIPPAARFWIAVYGGRGIFPFTLAFIFYILGWHFAFLFSGWAVVVCAGISITTPKKRVQSQGGTCDLFNRAGI